MTTGLFGAGYLAVVTSRPARLGLRDWGPALGLAVVQLGAGRMANAQQLDALRLDEFGYLLLALGPAALLVRQRFPLSTLTVALAAAVAFVLRGYGYGPVFLSLIVAFVTAATHGSRLRTYPAIPLGYLALVWPLPVAFGQPAPDWWQAIGIAAWLMVLIATVEGVRQRRAVLEARRERAESARRDEETQRLRRAGEERLAIARELHDVLGHSLSLINVQASVALALLERKPEHAAIALTAIRDASRDALGEVHTLLNSIRGAESAPTAPVPSIADLDAVVHHARAAGIDVRTEVTGTPRRLSSVVDVAAARIVREALTNVAKHAPGAAATVTVDYTPRELHVRIDNDAPDSNGGASSEAGSGIPGMLERAVALGGKLAAGPLTGDGFRVDARLPIAGRDGRDRRTNTVALEAP